jgi:hypothetical protein
MRITRFAAVLSLALAAAPTLMAATRFMPVTNASSGSLASATKLPADMGLLASIHSVASPLRAPFTMTATVNGSYDMRVNTPGYFFAVGNGGTSPYSYTWYLDGSWIGGPGSASSWSGYLSAGTHYTYAYVTDSGGQGAWSNTLYINVHY